MTAADRTLNFVSNDQLFAPRIFEAAVRRPGASLARQDPADLDSRLDRLREIWESVRPRLVAPAPGDRRYVGLPQGLRPVDGVAESVTEQDFVRVILHDVLGLHTENNRTFRDTGGTPHRPDVIVFGDEAAHRAAVSAVDKRSKRAAADARTFCRDAHYILDAKKFAKGIGADEVERARDEKGNAIESSAIEDIDQVHRYLKAAGKTWGVLTNGRSFRLMRAGTALANLRFDLVAFLESMRGRAADDADRETFRLFYYLFGPPAVGAAYLDRLLRESDADVRKVRDILRTQAHAAVSMIASGYLRAAENEFAEKPEQAVLDHVRELALVLLYRLLFVLKAEAQNLLPMRDALGQETRYAKFVSTRQLFAKIDAVSPHERSLVDVGYRDLQQLFQLIDRGGAQYEVPAYNGGLFDRELHAELDRLTLRDDVVHRVLGMLIYVGGQTDNPVPYEDLDVRDFGDIYEGLLEQRLVADEIDGRTEFALKNENGERKASGSYFTPDGLVEQVVDRVVGPLLDAAGDDVERLLSLRIVDPAMGSGHFLVKVVDRIAWRLTLRCDPLEPDAPRDNGPEEYAYWKRRVVEHCIYGVDVNPMAVELAKVALWLHTASRGKALSFLDHHLKCGNSLVGTRLANLSDPPLQPKQTKKGAIWEVRPRTMSTTPTRAPATKKRRKKADEGQLELLLHIDPNVVGRILGSARALLARPSDSSADVKAKSKAYATEVEGRLAAHRMLADLHCLQWFLGEATQDLIVEYESATGLYHELKIVAGLGDDAQRAYQLARLADHPLLRRLKSARDEGYGPRLLRFFHWELEFPELAFDEKGRLRDSLAFDGVVGNPPWDKIKAATRDFYGPFSPEVQKRQGPSLDRLVREIDSANPGLDGEWSRHVARIGALTSFLGTSGEYQHQVAKVNGRRTGGDPDLFRYFVERAAQLVKPGGRWGLVVPTTLLQAEGCTGLRRLLLTEHRLESAFSFENYRKWAFDIHSSFKFTAFVASRRTPEAEATFEAAFMLRDLRPMHGLAPERIVRLTRADVESMSPDSLAMLDLKGPREAELVARLHAQHPPLGAPESGWSVKYQRELDMTNDAWLFKTREFMRARGFTSVEPVRTEDGTWTQTVTGPGVVARLPVELPPGGEYWIAAHEEYYRSRGYLERYGTGAESDRRWFVHPEDVGEHERMRRIFPLERYTALYEGRMVHQYDHAKKAYVSGEGRTAIWTEIRTESKSLVPRVFVSACDAQADVESARVGFCDITGQTNERSMLAALLPAGVVAGNKVPVVVAPCAQQPGLLALLNSFVGDFLLRLRISTTLNWVFVRSLVVPAQGAAIALTSAKVSALAAELSCTTPELADAWRDLNAAAGPWTRGAAPADLRERARRRAQLDAIVADAYGLSVPEFAYVLSTFPLLDRDQAPLSGDAFVTEGGPKSRVGTRGVDWDETDDGIVELSPRSFVTRDLALFTYMKLKGFPIPEDLEAFYRDQVGVDPRGSQSRFRVGSIRDLEARVIAAEQAGAIAYVPSGRGGDAEE